MTYFCRKVKGTPSSPKSVYNLLTDYRPWLFPPTDQLLQQDHERREGEAAGVRTPLERGQGEFVEFQNADRGAGPAML